MQKLSFVWLSGLAVVLVSLPHPLYAQNLLPQPTGKSAVGRVTYHWVDSARPEPLAQGPAAQRELMVDIWYPAQTAAAKPPATYLPDLPIAAKVLGEVQARKVFGAAYDAMTDGRLTAHAQGNAEFAADAGKCPVLIFSHGLGVLKTGYTAQIEDLVSHGYIVVAIAHTYDTWIVSFPDGRIVRFDQAGRKAHSGSEAERNEYGDQRLQVWVADIRFVIDQLTRYDRETEFHSPLTGHLDLHRIGAFGHSDGGRAAALACQTDERVRACMDLDGVADNMPFHRDVRGNTMRQPFLLFVREKKSGPASDADLKEMGYSREDFSKLITAVAEKQTSLLRNMPSGAYRISLKTDASHMSFSDLPLIESADKPALYKAAISNQDLVRRYTRAFFDETLRGQTDGLLNHRSQNLSELKIEWFPPQPKRRESANVTGSHAIR